MSSEEITRTSTIRFDVHLDKENLPVSIDWAADDGEFNEPQAAKAIMVGLWDGLQKEAMRIDLWTKEMSIEEMSQFTFQYLMTWPIALNAPPETARQPTLFVKLLMISDTKPMFLVLTTNTKT